MSLGRDAASSGSVETQKGSTRTSRRFRGVIPCELSKASAREISFLTILWISEAFIPILDQMPYMFFPFNSHLGGSLECLAGVGRVTPCAPQSAEDRPKSTCRRPARSDAPYLLLR